MNMPSNLPKKSILIHPALHTKAKEHAAKRGMMLQAWVQQAITAKLMGDNLRKEEKTR
jgi:hypothetical protein